MTNLAPMLTVPEAARLLRRSERTLYRQIATGADGLGATPKPPRVPARRVLAITGLTEKEAADYLAAATYE